MVTGKLWELHGDDTLRRIDAAAAVYLLVQGGCCLKHSAP